MWPLLGSPGRLLTPEQDGGLGGSNVHLPTKATKTINKQLQTSEKTMGKLWTTAKEAGETTRSSKTKHGRMEEPEKHFLCVTPCPSPEQLSPGGVPSEGFTPWERRPGGPQQAAPPLLLRTPLPPVFTNADPSRRSGLETLPLCPPGSGTVAAVRPAPRGQSPSFDHFVPRCRILNCCLSHRHQMALCRLFLS